MFDIGFLELSIILVLSLLVLGPERLPKAAKSVGYWFGKMRRYVDSMKSQVEAEFDTAEVKRLLHNQEVQIRELQSKLQGDIDELSNDSGHGEFEPSFTDQSEDSSKQQSEKKAEYPQYDMIEEDDDEWDKLTENNSRKTEVTSTEVKQVADDSDEVPASEGKAQ